MKARPWRPSANDLAGLLGYFWDPLTGPLPSVAWTVGRYQPHRLSHAQPLLELKAFLLWMA
jgi:hypothetical protein